MTVMCAKIYKYIYQQLDSLKWIIYFSNIINLTVISSQHLVRLYLGVFYVCFYQYILLTDFTEFLQTRTKFIRKLFGN